MAENYRQAFSHASARLSRIVPGRSLDAGERRNIAQRAFSLRIDSIGIGIDSFALVF
jgi:hypothetical protein